MDDGSLSYHVDRSLRQTTETRNAAVRIYNTALIVAGFKYKQTLSNSSKIKSEIRLNITIPMSYLKTIKTK